MCEGRPGVYFVVVVLLHCMHVMAVCDPEVLVFSFVQDDDDDYMEEDDSDDDD